MSGTARYADAPTKQKAGLGAPLKFTCGVNNEMTVDGWKATLKKQPKL